VQIKGSELTRPYLTEASSYVNLSSPDRVLAVMRFTNWVLTSLLFLIMGTAHRLAPSTGRFSKQNSCIALVAKHHFQINSTVAVLPTNSYEYQRPTTFTSKPAISEDSLVKLLSLGSHFSLVVLKPHENNSHCSNKSPSKIALNYFIFAGSLPEVSRWIETFCFDRLTHDGSHFVVYLELKTSDERYIVRHILELFWSNQHQNVIVLADGQYGEIDIYTWFPLEVPSQVEVVDRCDGTALR